MKLKLGSVRDLSITSATPLASIAVNDWLDTDANADLIAAPWIGSIVSKAQFQADIFASAANKGLSLAKLQAKGATDADFTLAGGAGSIAVGTWSGGSLAAVFAKTITVKGDLLGTDLLLSGAGIAAGKPVLGTLAVSGAATDALVAVGGNATSVKVGTFGAGSVLAVGVGTGGDGSYFDGNETATGGTLGSFFAKTAATSNSGAAFGFAIDNLKGTIQLSPTSRLTASTLPFTNGDLRAVLV